tara:strand:+ start:1107 stop:4112 length:3006 start_codon:yes stop_codon:yes gene_type:complete
MFQEMFENIYFDGAVDVITNTINTLAQQEVDDTGAIVGFDVPKKIVESVISTYIPHFKNSRRITSEELQILQSKEFIQGQIKRINQNYTLVRTGKTEEIYAKSFTEWYDPNAYDHPYWKRYLDYLEKNEKLPKSKIHFIEEDVDKVVKFLGNPDDVNNSWKRKGLVYGQVQQGKTMHYTGVINKAADVGYKIIVVLTTNNERLRTQTQERLEDGFVGKSSKGTRLTISGVGKHNSKISPNLITNRTSDFDKGKAKLGIRTDEPILVVMKKNTSILNNFKDWLNQDQHYKNKPLLFIDDEADHSSVNTKMHYQGLITTKDEEKADIAGDKEAQKIKQNGGSEEEQETAREARRDIYLRRKVITAINDSIRNVLETTTNSTFIAYSATPFANIFMDYEEHDEKAGDDLFPKDFLVKISQDNSYFGLRKMFLTDEDHYHKKGYLNGNTYLEIDDALRDDLTEDDLISHDHSELDSISHNTELIPEYEVDFKRLAKEGVTGTPESLKYAVRYFILSVVEKHKRTNNKTDNTMLINIAKVKQMIDLKSKIKTFLQPIKKSILNNSQLPLDRAIIDPEINELYKLWTKEKVLQYSYESQIKNSSLKKVFEKEVLKYLKEALDIEVVSIHGKSDDSLIYSDTEKKSKPINVIAVGGFIFGRGYTLKGLTVTYMLRNLGDIDTLLQTARWFGYRQDYEDLQKIWMSNDLSNKFLIASKTVKDLEETFTSMAQRGATPEEFGIAVLSHPDVINITNKRKIGFGQTIEQWYSYSGKNTGSWKIDSRKEIIEENTKIFKELYDFIIEEKKIPRTQIPSESEPFNIRQEIYGYKNVPIEGIIEFFEKYKTHISDTETSRIKKWIIDSYNDRDYEAFDVVFLGIKHPDNGTLIYKGMELNYLQRVGKRLVAWDQENNLISSPSRNFYSGNEDRNLFMQDGIRTNPLITLAFNQLKTKKDSNNVPNWTLNNPVPIYTLQFPKTKHKIRKIDEVINKVEYQLRLIQQNQYQDSEEE